jgi:hypothetical protein
MMFVVFMPWFVLSVGVGASRALVPIVMLLFAAAFSVGLWQLAHRSQRRE